jgi:hypothetical protein
MYNHVSLWKKMNHFLDDPLASRDMGIRDVLGVALLYDKYNFTQGRRLCENLIWKWLLS